MLTANYTIIAVDVCLKYPKMITFLIASVFLLMLLIPGFTSMYDTLGLAGIIVFGLIFCVAPGCLLGYGAVRLQRKIGKWYYQKHPELPKPFWWKEEFNN